MVKNYTNWQLPSVDDGCAYHDRCLSCPFSVCVFDDGHAVAREYRDMHGEEVNGEWLPYEHKARILELEETRNSRTIGPLLGIAPETVTLFLHRYRSRQKDRRRALA